MILKKRKRGHAVEASTAEQVESTSSMPSEPVHELQQIQPAPHRVRRMYTYCWSKKYITLPAAAVVFALAAVGAVPTSRYAILGLLLQKQVVVTVVDSQTQATVSKASVILDGHTVSTNTSGVAHVVARVGYKTLKISKQYYKSYSQQRLVTISASGNHLTIRLTALGRLVPITVKNGLTGNPATGVTVKILDTEAVTNTSGVATIVLPTTSATQQATISGNGYNMVAQTIQVTSQNISANTVEVTPVGKVYFLSNLSGKIDVVKTNLDGTDRQTVLAGTGNENSGTALLASRDWKYLALYAQRSQSGGPEIDLIDTSTDTMSNIDQGSNANFQLVGWDGDRFIYEVDRTSVQNWQDGQQALKSFDASKKAITILSQTDGSGTAWYDYVHQQFGTTYILNGKVVYVKNWYSSTNDFDTLSGKLATLNAVNPDGNGVVVLKSVSISPVYGDTSVSMNTAPYKGPNDLAVEVPGSPDTFYVYENGQISPASNMTDVTFYNGTHPTYLLSPSGDQTFWANYADGKNNLYTGDQNGQSGKNIAVESDYSPYGWYTDNYVLMSKNSSELYIMPVDGTGQPIKISNYYKPQLNYPNYGGGYGGI